MMPLAISIFVIITLACFNMNFARDGFIVETESIVERVQFMHEHLGLWQLLWLNWMLAALGLLLFACMLSRFLSNDYLRVYGLSLMCLGIVPDITGECIYAFILPKAFSVYGMSTESAQVLEVIAMNLTGTVGNGFYNIGGLLLNGLMLANARIPKWLVWSGLPAWPLGIALSVSTALANYPATEIFTILAMVWSTVWILIVGVTIMRKPLDYVPV